MLREVKSSNPIVALDCRFAFTFPYSTGGRDYAKISTMDVLSMIGNVSTV